MYSLSLLCSIYHCEYRISSAYMGWMWDLLHTEEGKPGSLCQHSKKIIKKKINLFETLDCGSMYSFMMDYTFELHCPRSFFADPQFSEYLPSLQVEQDVIYCHRVLLSLTRLMGLPQL